MNKLESYRFIQKIKNEDANMCEIYNAKYLGINCNGLYEFMQSNGQKFVTNYRIEKILEESTTTDQDN